MAALRPESFSVTRKFLRRSAIALASLLLTGTAKPSAGLPGADPHVAVIDGDYWLYPTNATGTDRLIAWSSMDQASWRPRGIALRMRDVAWIKADGARIHHLWAPALAAANGRYYLYYSVGPQRPTPSRLGVAVADRPEGPFVDSGKPLLTGGKGFEAIDPMVFIDPKDGLPYLYTGGSAGAKLRVFVLASDMITIAREIPIEQPARFTEAPFMQVRDGIYYLSYSRGRWNRDSYSVHYATAPGPTGPWTYRGRILASRGRYRGPGHHSFFQDAKTGDWWIAYHRWDRPGSEPFRGRREIALAPVRYKSDGTIEPINMRAD